MLTITIEKNELKRAFAGRETSYAQELTAESEITVDLDVILLQIMFENYNALKKSEGGRLT